MKAAVIYYSLDGNTELIANTFAKLTKAELIKLTPKKEISHKGFQKYFWGGKSVIFHEKPKLINEDIDLSNYDILFIGTPVWAGTFAPPLNTFLSKYKIENKKIYLFACHGGGGADRCFAKFKEKLTGNSILDTIDFLDPIKVDSITVQKKVETFLEKLK